MSERSACLILAALGVLTAALYVPNLHHEFLFDSVESILLNPAIRSLDNWRVLLTDPTALTNVRGNLDYRPVLMLVNTLNYQLSGTAMWGWHSVQILLHVTCGLVLYRLTLQLVQDLGAGAPSTARIAGVLAAALLLLHPTSAGVVNYVHARSSLLTAALLLAALLAFARYCASGNRRLQALTFVWFLLALFTKIEAIAALAVFAGLHLLYAARPAADRSLSALWRLLGGVLGPRLWLSLTPLLLAAAVALVLRQLLLPDYHVQARNPHHLDALDYLRTQFIVWWAYVGQWPWPVNLVADDLSWPIYRNWQLPVLIALAGWLVVLAGCARYAARWPLLAFGVCAYLIMLSPTSSVLPLGEMANEHRPYLPRALLSVPLAWALALALEHTVRHKAAAWLLRGALAAVGVAMAVGVTLRNPVYATREAYYSDIVSKAPSSRAHMNLGIEFLQRGRTDDALAQYQLARALVPQWHLPYLNIASVLARGQQDAAAMRYFDAAVERERWSQVARMQRGLHHLHMLRYPLAEADLRASIPGLTTPERAYGALIQAALGQGDVRRALAITDEMVRAVPARAETELQRIVTLWAQRPGVLGVVRGYLAGVLRRYPQWDWLATVLAEADAASNDPASAAPGDG